MDDDLAKMPVDINGSWTAESRGLSRDDGLEAMSADVDGCCTASSRCPSGDAGVPDGNGCWTTLFS